MGSAANEVCLPMRSDAPVDLLLMKALAKSDEASAQASHILGSDSEGCVVFGYLRLAEKNVSSFKNQN